jgi:hypothetical protein
VLKKTLTVSFFVVLVHSLAFGFQRGAPWQPFNSPEGKFNVLTPSKPKLQIDDVDSPSGKLQYYRFTSVSKIGLFSITYFDHPELPKDAGQIEARIDVIRDGILGSLGGERISEKKIRLFGYPGREFAVKKAEQGSEDLLYQWRIFLVGRRVYQVVVATDRKDSGSPDVAKFFTSFVLSR